MDTSTVRHESARVKPAHGRRSVLTDSQRDQVAEAWEALRPHLRSVKRKHPRMADQIEALTHIRLVELIPSFDARRSSLSTWAFRNFRYAALDSLRRQETEDVSPRLHRNTGRGWVVPASLERVVAMDGAKTLRLREVIDNGDPEPEWINFEETREHLLKVLSPEHRFVFRKYSIGWTMREIAEHLGISESRVSQIRTQCQPILLDRLAALRA